MISTSEDEDIFHALIWRIPPPADSPADIGELLLAVGTFFLGTPYTHHTLEQAGPERLTINLRQLDCFTFLETTLALAGVIRSGRTTWPDFTAALQASRYRRSCIDGYASRLHYFSDWLDAHQSRGSLQDMTALLGGIRRHKELNFMTTHRDLYPALADPDTLQLLRAVETTCSARVHHHLPAAAVPACRRQIHNGDIIAITTSIAGLDVAHVGLAIHQKRGLHLLHASERAGRVIVSPETLSGYLRQRPSREGIMVARML